MLIRMYITDQKEKLSILINSYNFPPTQKKPCLECKKTAMGFQSLRRQNFQFGRIFSQMAELFGGNGRLPLENFGNSVNKPYFLNFTGGDTLLTSSLPWKLLDHPDRRFSWKFNRIFCSSFGRSFSSSSFSRSSRFSSCCSSSLSGSRFCHRSFGGCGQCFCNG